MLKIFNAINAILYLWGYIYIIHNITHNIVLILNLTYFNFKNIRRNKKYSWKQILSLQLNTFFDSRGVT